MRSVVAKECKIQSKKKKHRFQLSIQQFPPCRRMIQLWSSSEYAPKVALSPPIPPLVLWTKAYS